MCACVIMSVQVFVCVHTCTCPCINLYHISYVHLTKFSCVPCSFVSFNTWCSFQNEITFKLRITDNHQVMNGSIEDLQLYSCCFNPERRKETMAQVRWQLFLITCANVGGFVNPLGECLLWSFWPLPTLGKSWIHFWGRSTLRPDLITPGGKVSYEDDDGFHRGCTVCGSVGFEGQWVPGFFSPFQSLIFVRGKVSVWSMWILLS
jgi:hypothetical protein